MKPKIIADPGTPEWYAARKKAIGASEVAAALNMSPFMTALELYHRKRGELPEVEDTEAMRLGRLLEPAVKTEFCNRTGKTLLNNNPPMAAHPHYACLVATPDAIINNEELLECKTTTWRMRDQWGVEDTDEIPMHYLCQCQAQMAVWNAAVVHVAVLIDGSTLKLYRVERNTALIMELIEGVVDLWERIVNGNPPQPDWTHPSTAALIRELYQDTTGERVVLSDEAVADWREYESLSRAIKQLEDARELKRARVLHAIGNNYAGILPDGRMLRRKLITRKEYVVPAKSYWDLRAVKSESEVDK
jgi:putative phage-type endonuclease